jgi:hypothetical protein
MGVRKRRSVSIPPELDAQIEAAAGQAGTSYSAWLTDVARKELAIRAGLEAVAEFEREYGAFSAAELAESQAWARDAVARSRRTGQRRRRSA